MEEQRYITDQAIEGISDRKRKGIMVSIIALCGFIFLYECFNLYEVYYEGSASLTSVYPFLLIGFEWIRAVIFSVIIYGLIDYLLHFRRHEEKETKGLTIVQNFLRILLAVSVISLFFSGFILWNMFLMWYLVVIDYYLTNWIKYLKKTRNDVPDPLSVFAGILILSAFLIFHYFYLENGGDYSERAYVPLFALHTPFPKIALLLLIQTALILVVSIINPFDERKRIARVMPLALAGIILITLTSMGFIESTTSHYRFSVFEADLDTQIEIQITNGSSSITPLPFYTVTNEDVTVDSDDLDDYMKQYDFDPSQSLNKIPVIDAKTIVTMSIAEGTLCDQIVVYDSDKNIIIGIHKWYQLEDLDRGTYYVVAKVSTLGDPCFWYSDNLFILTVS